METKKEEVLNLSLKNEEIKNFKSIIEKIHKDESKIGFAERLLNVDEKKLLTDISKSIT